jgi:hypothetical protein
MLVEVVGTIVRREVLDPLLNLELSLAGLD